MALKTDVFFSGSAEKCNDYIKIAEDVCRECTSEYTESLYAAIHFTDNAEIKEKNKRFRNVDRPTDVLSFPMLEAHNGKLEYSEGDTDMENGCILLGDIMVSLDKVTVQAEEYGHSVEREIAFLICHGMLHLLGYDHEHTDTEKKMIKKQKTILSRLGYKRQGEKE